MKLKKDSLKEIYDAWGNCIKCPIGKFATKKVFSRGNPTARVIFVGEGPGRSEDVIGVPFIGRAGRLLDEAIVAAGFVPNKDAFFTNLVACRPADQIGGPNRAPNPSEVSNCSERLDGTIKVVRPKAIVWLGRVPQGFAGSHRQGRAFFMPHPSWVLRSGGKSGRSFVQMVERLKEVFSYAIGS